MSEKWDVIVVGAGCAGSAAAKKAAEKGLKTLLLEKGRTPGDRAVCGSAITVWGMSYAPYALKGPIERTPVGHRCYYIRKDGSFSCIEARGPNDVGPSLWCIRRDRFDPWHANLAVEAGATLRCSTTVMDIIRQGEKVTGVVTDKGEKLASGVVVDCGGNHSIVGRKAGLVGKRRGTDNVLYCRLDVELPERVINERIGDYAEWYLDEKEELGYKVHSWIFPMKNSVMVGGGGYMDGKLMNVNEYVKNLLKFPVVKKKLSGGKIRAWGAKCDPDLGLAEKLYADGLLLAGDAGGFVQPFVGEGMGFAFLSGAKAAEVAAEAISKGDTSEEALKKYDTRVRSDPVLSSWHRMGKEMKDLFLRWPQDAVVKKVCALSWWYTLPFPFLVTEGFKEKNFSKIKDAIEIAEGGEILDGVVKGIAASLKTEKLAKPPEEVLKPLDFKIVVQHYPGDTGEFLRVDESKCTGCATCERICPTGVWKKVGEIYRPAALSKCVECGACWDMCEADAIDLNEPKGGTGVHFTCG
jgi:electron transfer flavoprotein-quinone oxidoreductase